jgi:hypothetical protein
LFTGEPNFPYISPNNLRVHSMANRSMLTTRRGAGEDKPLPLLAELLDHVAKTGPPMVPRECQRSGGQHTGVVQVVDA